MNAAYASCDLTPDQRDWAEGTRVLDESGDPMVVYHGTRADFDKFEKQRGADAGFHFGSQEQARMRCGKQGTLKAALLRIRKPMRVRDKVRWSQTMIARAAAQGYDGIVYLNRYEGINKGELFKALEAYPGDKLDLLSDAAFRKVFPSARDSYIVFSDDQILSLTEVPPVKPDVISLPLPLCPSYEFLPTSYASQLAGR